MKNTQTELLKMKISEMKNTLGKINRLDVAEGNIRELEDGNNNMKQKNMFLKNKHCMGELWVTF